METKRTKRTAGLKVLFEGAGAAGLFAALLAVFPVTGHGQDNQWVTVNPTFRTIPKYPGAKLNYYNAWASLRYRSKTNSVLAWRQVLDDRRKDGIYANALVQWSLKDNTIDLLNASNYAGGTYEPNPSFTLMPEFQNDTTPAPRHTYDCMAYVDSTDAVYIMLGAFPRVNNYDNNRDPVLNAAMKLDLASSWKYSFSTGRWTRLPSVRQFWTDYYCGECVPFHENHMAYWPSKGKLVFVSVYMATAGRKVAEMDLKTEQWSKVTPTNAAPFPLDQALSTWDSRREAMVFRNGTKVCRYDAATRTFSSLPDCGVDADSNRPYYTDIEYIPAYDVYFVAGKNGLTRVYDNATGAWITVANDAAKLAMSATESSIYLEYDPSTGKVALSSHGSGTYGGFRTFLYKPDGATINTRPRTGSRSVPDTRDLAFLPVLGFIGKQDGVFSAGGRLLQLLPGSK